MSPPDALSFRSSQRQRVIEAMHQWLRDGTLAPGGAVPSEMDIGARIGVSQPTVQRALRELEASGLIRRVAGRRRVVAEPAPGTVANRTMTRTVAVGSPLLESQAAQIHPGYDDARLVGVYRELRERQLHCFQFDPSVIPLDELAGLANSGIPAAIFPHGCEANSPILATAERLRARGMAVVAYGDDPKLANFDRVSSDHHAGGRLVVDWLLSRGRQNLIQVGTRRPEPEPWAINRMAGMSDALAGSGRDWLAKISLPFFSPQAALVDWPDEALDFYVTYLIGHLAPLLRAGHRPDAMVLITDGLIEPARLACLALGLIPGGDVLIAGYDNYWTANYIREGKPSPPDVTVDRCNELCGRELCRLAHDRVGGLLSAQPAVRFIAPNVIVPN